MIEPPRKTIGQKLRENLAALREQGAPREVIQQEINRAKSAYDRVSADERKLSPMENMAAMGSSLASGATFGGFDELAGLVGGQGAKDTQRFLQGQFREENPGQSMILEGMGSLAMPGTILKPAARAASTLAKAGRVVGEGALQGAAAGFGNAEGNVRDRLGEAFTGAGAGSVMAGAFGGAGKMIGRTARGIGEWAGVVAPKIERVADNIPEADLGKARERLAQLTGRNLGHETMVADVLPQGEGVLRQQAVAGGREIRKRVDAELRQRSNRLANEADDRLSQHTGTQRQSARRSVEDLSAEASTRARPHYQAAAQEAAAAPKVDRLSAAQRAEMEAMGVPGGKVPTDVIDEALALPFVQKRIPELRAAPRSTFAKATDDDHGLLDQVYKDIGQEIRSLPREQWALKQDLIKQRGVLAEAITSRAPSYRAALDEFADPMARRDAYELGADSAPADIIPSQMKDLDPAQVPSFKEGKVQTLRRDVPNMDVGEFARFSDVLAPIANREKADVFKATFGEPAYQEYLRDVLEMAQLQRMKAGAGESTTVDKMMEQIQADPDALVGVFQSLLSGSPIQAVTKAARFDKIIGRMRASKSAQGNADFLLQRGEGNVASALDRIEQLRAEGKLPGSRDWRRPNPTAAVARQSGAATGRP